MSRAIVLCTLTAVLAGAAPRLLGAQAKVTLSETEYRDKVYACWIGKSIGGTVGMPVEGQREMHDFTFYTPVPTQPAANDDLDLQLLWLKALEERGPRIDARVLGEYWLSFVPVDWNEYGIGKANMRQGFLPPISGQFRNKWRDSNGAWIRSEIWACVAPGCPALAARYAYEDACVDHGGAEGTYAELFTAAVESAAFVESDRDRLLQIGLSFIPADCGVAKSIHAAIEARRKGLDLKAARETVVEASKATGWFMAPQNVAFVVLGWLYGEDDFGKTVCGVVNCGDDTDSTGACIGSLMGILHGMKGISEAWRKPVGEEIRNVAIGGFQPPANLAELTDHTVSMARRVLVENEAPVEISADRPTDLSGIAALKLDDASAAKALWARSPYQLAYDFVSVRATLDMLGDPEMEADQPRSMKLLLENVTPHPMEVVMTWRVPAGLTADPATAKVQLPPQGHDPVVCEVTVTAEGMRNLTVRGSVEIAPAGRPGVGVIPFALAGRVTVDRTDLALARLGAKATSDSELEREQGCTARAIDGIIPAEDDFEGKRWHSALTPHPHWVAVELPQAHAISHVIIHFADPTGHPVDFDGEVSADGQTWQTVLQERDYQDARRYEKTLAPVEARHFRLTIRRSANPQYPNAAQVSEIELLP